MACTGRYAESWQFASFFCTGVILQNVDDSGGAGNAFLTDSTVDFLAPANRGEAGVGMVLSNALAAGVIRWHLHWMPLSDDGFLEAV